MKVPKKYIKRLDIMRLHRLIGIINLLNSRGTLKAKEIGDILEASERTVYRDIDLLCEAGIPIISIAGPNGGFAFIEGYKFPAEDLYEGEIINLILSSMGVNIDKNTDMGQELRNATIKLENALPDKYKEQIKNVRERFHFDEHPWRGEKVENNNVDIIKKAILSFKKLKITYKKYLQEESTRIIRPYGVIVKNAEWYLAGFCEEKNAERVFKCTRIHSIELLNEGFTMPSNFSLDEFWEKSKIQFIKKSKLSNVANENYLVKIKCFNVIPNMLEAFKIVERIEAVEYSICKIDMISFKTACNIMLSLSDEIVILEPAELKDFIINKAEKILKINGV